MRRNSVYRLATAIGGSLLLGVAALGIAGATGGGGAAGDVLQTLRLSSSSGESAVASTTPTPAPTPTLAPTPTSASTPTLVPTPTSVSSPTPATRMAATNPDGHCVMLPATSDIVEQPEKHPGWHLLGGDCATPSPAGLSGSPTPASPGASPGPRTAATNPDGHCVMLPDTSDVIRQPDKHPAWHAVGGGCPSASATSGATPAPSPTPTPTP